MVQCPVRTDDRCWAQLPHQHLAVGSVMASIRRLGSEVRVIRRPVGNRGFVIRRLLGKATNISRLGSEAGVLRRPGGQRRTPRRPGGQWQTPWRLGSRTRGLLEAKGDVWGLLEAGTDISRPQEAEGTIRRPLGAEGSTGGWRRLRRPAVGQG